MKFFYGSYESVIAEYSVSSADNGITPKTNLKNHPVASSLDEFSTKLLLSGFDQENTNELALVQNLDHTSFSKYRTGAVNVKKEIVERYIPSYNKTEQQIHDRVCDYFCDELIDNIAEGYDNCLKHDLLEVIDSDRTISNEVKAKFRDLANNESLVEFLTETFIFAIRVKVRRPIVKFMISNIPFVQNVWFTGRKTELDEIYENFRNGEKWQTISGITGSGKTQLAVEYIYWQAKSYNYVCWINAETEDGILNSMGEMLKAVNAPHCKSTDRYGNARDFLCWINNKKDWLIVYDNLDYSDPDFKEIFEERYLVKNNKNGNILITTQNRQPFYGEPIINIDVFSDDDAVFFVKRRCGRVLSAEDARKLADRLGNYPIALEQASSFLSRRQYEECDSYIKLLDENRTYFLNRFDKPRGHKLSAYETISIALNNIENQGAVELLKLLSYGNPDGIDVIMIKHLVNRYGTDVCANMRDIFCNKLSFYEAIDAISDYSLCEFVYDDSKEYADFGGIRIIRFHRLVQEILRDIVGDDMSYLSVWVNYYYDGIIMSNRPASFSWIDESTNLLERSYKTFENSNDIELLKKISELYHATMCVSYGSTEDSRVCVSSEHLMGRYVEITAKAYGDRSVEAAFAACRYFFYYGLKDWDQAIKWFDTGIEVALTRPEEYLKYINGLQNNRLFPGDGPFRVATAFFSHDIRYLYGEKDRTRLERIHRLVADNAKKFQQILPDEDQDLWFGDKIEGSPMCSFEEFIKGYLTELRK